MRRLALLLVALAFACGSEPATPGTPDGGSVSDAAPPRSDAGPPLFQEQPPCNGTPVTPLAGDTAMVISRLAIGDLEDGFDLDGDGTPDNKLTAVGALAGPSIDDAFASFQIIIPLELFDFASVAGPEPDECVKVAFYLGIYPADGDADGAKTVLAGGDCDDHDAAAKPGNPEIAGNGKDDNCDGLADETASENMTVPSASTADDDGDGVTIAAGDCDDGNPAVDGGAEVCGDGFDNDCNGLADDGCIPYDDSPDLLALDPLSFEADGSAKVVFPSGRTEAAGGGIRLHAGPARFQVTVPITEDIKLDLRITGATFEADLVQNAGGLGISNGRLGGVLDAHTLDTVRGVDNEQLGLSKEDSLLDAIFANVVGQLIGLKKNALGCRMPDIDVDRDGLEAFCDSDQNDDKFAIDKCIDGDGTVYLDEKDTAGMVTKHCTEVTNADGTFKFIDGVSIELNFEAVKTLLPPPTAR